MRRRPLLLVGLWLSACALPHLERREQAAGDQTAGDANAGSSADAGAAGKPPPVGAAGNSHAGVGGSDMAGSNASGAPDISDAGEAGSTSAGASASGGTAGSRGGTAGSNGGTAGSNGGTAGSNGGTAGSRGGTAGSSGGTAGSNTGTAGAGGCTTKNACGGCTALTGAVGEVCTGCGKLACNGFNALMCESSCAAPKAACNSTTNQCVACLTDPDCPAATPVCNANACLVCKPSSTGCSGTTPTSCNATGSTVSYGAVHSGTCGATCDPGVLRCNNLLPQKCATNGTGYVSSGSNTQCGCTDSGGRFTFISDKQVKDSLTGLTWDFPEHAPDTNAGASTTCTGKGMRLPTPAELENLLLATAPAAACTQKLYLAIDSVAFPGIVATTRYWTGTAETGFPGNYFVVYFFGPTSQMSVSGYGTTDRTSSQLVAFQCVQG